MMDAQFRAAIDGVVEELKQELYQKVPRWSQTRTPSELFDFEQELQATLNTLQANIVSTVLEEIHRDADFVTACQEQAVNHRGLPHWAWVEVPVRTLSGKRMQIKTPYSRSQRKVNQEPKVGKRQQGVGIYPLLRWLGIVRGATPRLLAEANRQMADGPSGAEAVERLASREIILSKGTMGLRVRDFASIALWQRQKATASLDQVKAIEPAPLAGKRVVVGLDGGRLRIRISKKGDRQAETKGYTTGKCEPKLLVIYTIDQKGSKERRGEVIYDGTIQSAEYIFALLTLRLKQLGIAQAELLVITGDGARWIWKGAAELRAALGLEKARVVEIVDFAHSVAKLIGPAKLGIRGYGQQQKWFKKTRRLLKKGQVDTVIAALRDLDCSQDEEGDIRKAIGYLQTHRARMQYGQFRAEGLPIGSGVIESGVRRIVSLRMKGASMFWLPENAESILYLRCQIKSGRWVTFVKSVLSQWAADMTVSLPQARQIRNQIASQFLESHPSVYVDSRSEVIKWACELLEDGDALIVDTETTGLTDNDEVIQLAIVDLDGKVLLNTLLKPNIPVAPEACAVHGIIDQHLLNAPTISDLYGKTASLIRNRHLIAYNANFDCRLLIQTCEKYGLPRFEVAGWDCVMEKYACFWGKRYGKGNCKPQKA